MGKNQPLKREFDFRCRKGRRDLGKVLPSWDAPHMRLSTDDRCRLQSRELLKPNTPYEGQLDATGRVVLTELMPKAGPVRFGSKEEVIRAIKSSRLKFRRSWEQICKETREP